MTKINVMGQVAMVLSEKEVEAFQNIQKLLNFKTFDEAVNFIVKYGAEKAIETLKK